MLVALITVLLHKMPAGKAAVAWKDTLVKMKAATVALMASVALVKIFQGSGFNPALAEAVQAGTAQFLPSMPLAMAISA